MAKTRRSYEGGALSTTTTSAIAASGTTSFTITAYTGWPYGAAPFYVVVAPGTASEEKILVTRTGSTDTTINVASDDERGQDGTSAVSHASGSTVFPVFTAVDADEANELTSSWSAKGDLVSHGSTTFETLAVGTNDEVLTADSSAASGLAWKDTLSVASASVSGDLTVDTDTLHVDSTDNRVGIGTTTPDRALTVDATETVAANFKSSFSNSSISFVSSGTTSDTSVRIGASGDQMKLFAGDAERVRIDSSGNVGIGTPTPGKQLDVQGAGVVEARLLSTDGGDTALLFGDSVDSIRGSVKYDTSEDRLELRGYNNSERLVIDSSGNVGINDLTPSYRLDVNGDINSQTDVLVSGTSLPRGLLANFDTQGDFTIGSSYTDIGSISFTLSEQRQILLTAFIPLWQSFSSSTGITVVYMTSGPASSPGTFYQGSYQSMGSGNHFLSIQRMITLNAATYTVYLIGLRTVGTAQINGGSNIRRTTFSAIDMGGT